MTGLMNKADIYGKGTNLKDKPVRDGTAIEASGANGGVTSDSAVKSVSFSWVAFVLALVAIRVLEGIIPEG
jgi:hypothetical protein